MSMEAIRPMTAAYKMMTAKKLPRETTLRQRIETVPDDLLYAMTCKTYALCNLAWQYVGSVIDFCVQQRIDGTKRLVRAVRELKNEYDSFRDHCFSHWVIQKDETRNAEALEDFAAEDFSKLFYALDTEVSKLGLDANNKMLVVGVHQALTVIEAVKMYASQCDKILEKYGVMTRKYTLVQREFVQMSRLVPEFAGDCYFPAKSCKLTAKILLNRVNEIGVRKYEQANP